MTESVSPSLRHFAAETLREESGEAEEPSGPGLPSAAVTNPIYCLRQEAETDGESSGKKQGGTGPGGRQDKGRGQETDSRRYR